MSRFRRKVKRRSGPTLPTGHIARSWEGFAKMVLPDDASEARRAEARKAFFGGAALVFQIIMKVVDGDEGEAIRFFSELDAEIREYGAALDDEHLGDFIKRHIKHAGSA